MACSTIRPIQSSIRRPHQLHKAPTQTPARRPQPPPQDPLQAPPPRPSSPGPSAPSPPRPRPSSRGVSLSRRSLPCHGQPVPEAGASSEITGGLPRTGRPARAAPGGLRPETAQASQPATAGPRRQGRPGRGVCAGRVSDRGARPVRTDGLGPETTATTAPGRSFENKATVSGNAPSLPDEPCWTRTSDLGIKSPLLYPLS